jgi:hypothetical protein
LINFEWGQTLTAFQPSENSLDFHLEQLTQSQEINLVRNLLEQGTIVLKNKNVVSALGIINLLPNINTKKIFQGCFMIFTKRLKFKYY